jgi:ADP-glucose pyrophosphorylase
MDVNLTFPEDLLQVNLIELSRSQRSSLTGTNLRIHPETTLENCVVGNKVTIPFPIRISNAVVFDDVVVQSKKPLDSCIVTATQVIACRLDTI